MLNKKAILIIALSCMGLLSTCGASKVKIIPESSDSIVTGETVGKVARVHGTGFAISAAGAR